MAFPRLDAAMALEQILPGSTILVNYSESVHELTYHELLVLFHVPKSPSHYAVVNAEGRQFTIELSKETMNENFVSPGLGGKPGRYDPAWKKATIVGFKEMPSRTKVADWFEAAAARHNWPLVDYLPIHVIVADKEAGDITVDLLDCKSFANTTTQEDGSKVAKPRSGSKLKLMSARPVQGGEKKSNNEDEDWRESVPWRKSRPPATNDDEWSNAAWEEAPAHFDDKQFKCANTGCSFAVHSDHTISESHCCKLCQETDKLRPGQRAHHGRRCEQRLYVERSHAQPDEETATSHDKPLTPRQPAGPPPVALLQELQELQERPIPQPPESPPEELSDKAKPPEPPQEKSVPKSKPKKKVLRESPKAGWPGLDRPPLKEGERWMKASDCPSSNSQHEEDVRRWQLMHSQSEQANSVGKDKTELEAAHSEDKTLAQSQVANHRWRTTEAPQPGHEEESSENDYLEKSPVIPVKWRIYHEQIKREKRRKVEARKQEGKHNLKRLLETKDDKSTEKMEREEAAPCAEENIGDDPMQKGRSDEPRVADSEQEAESQPKQARLEENNVEEKPEASETEQAELQGDAPENLHDESTQYYPENLQEESTQPGDVDKADSGKELRTAEQDQPQPDEDNETRQAAAAKSQVDESNGLDPGGSSHEQPDQGIDQQEILDSDLIESASRLG